MATALVDTRSRQAAQTAVELVQNELLQSIGSPTDPHHLQEACHFCFDVLMSHFTRTP
jgi:hypothetical protein